MSSDIPQADDKFDDYTLTECRAIFSYGALWTAKNTNNHTVILLMLKKEFDAELLLDDSGFSDILGPGKTLRITGGSLKHEPPYIIFSITGTSPEPLQSQGETIPMYAEAELADSSVRSRPLKDRTLRKLEKQIKNMVNELQNKSHLVRTTAAKGLGELGLNAISAVPNLVKTLFDDWSGARAAAAEALGNMREKASEAVPFLIQLLDHEKDNVRIAVIKALGNIGSAAREAIPLLLEELEQPTGLYVAKSRAAATATLIQMSKHLDDDEIRHIADLIANHPINTVRKNAIRILTASHPVPDNSLEQIIDNLIIALKNTAINESAEKLLVLIGYETVPKLAEALDDMATSYMAAATLSRIGVASMQPLVDGLVHDKPFVRGNCTWALGQIGPPAKSALPQLYELLTDPDSMVRSRAAWAMGKMGNEGVDYLIKARSGTDPMARRAAKLAFRKLER
ncbi:MAG: HEAT repeat domain-containing protein [Planctomycetota bacterium]|jgi:HEAT repeat protein